MANLNRRKGILRTPSLAQTHPVTGYRDSLSCLMSGLWVPGPDTEKS